MANGKFDSILFLDKIKRQLNSNKFDYYTQNLSLKVPSGEGMFSYSINLNQDIAIVVVDNFPETSIIESPTYLEVKPNPEDDLGGIFENMLNLELHTNYINIMIPKDDENEITYDIQLIRVTKN